MYLTDEMTREYEQQVEKLTRELLLRSPAAPPFIVGEAHAANLRERPNSIRNIIGCGYGEKLVNGTPQGVLAIGVYVVRKVPPTDIHPDFLAENLISKLLGGQYLSDVIEVGRPRLLHHARRRYPQRVPGGAAISDDTGRATGTLGGWVADEEGNVYLLSCWHCIDASPGGTTGRKVLQPPGGNAIATIAASTDPAGCRRGTTTIDASLARVDDLARVGDFVLQIGEIRGSKRVNATYVRVLKSGATTHLTTGRIVQLGANMWLNLPSVGQGVLYEKQLLIYPDAMQTQFADFGDSGALILTDDNNVVGLLIGGDHLPPNYIATPILDVLNSLRSGSLRFLTY